MELKIKNSLPTVPCYFLNPWVLNTWSLFYIFIIIAFLIPVITGNSMASQSARSVVGSKYVPVLIREHVGISSSGIPIRGGFPISRNANITSTTQIELLDSTYAPVPVQMTVLSRWGGTPSDPTKPIRWVLLDYQTDLAASENKSMFVHYDSSKTFTQTYPVEITTTEDATHITVNTGSAVFMIKKNNCNIFDQVTVGGVPVVEPGNSDLVFTASGTTYRSSLGTSNASILINGPLRTTIKVSGSFEGDVIDYSMILHFFAGKSFARVFFRLENNTSCANSQDRDDFISTSEYISNTCHCLESPGNKTFTYAGMEIQPAFTTTRTVTAQAEIGIVPFVSTANNVKIYQDSSGTLHWDRLMNPVYNPRMESYVTFRGYRVTENSIIKQTGNQANGLLDMSDGVIGISGGIRHLWQNYPKSLEATNNILRIGIFPGDYAGDYHLRPGEYKTHEIIMYFHSGDFSTSEAYSRTASLLNPVYPLPPDDYVMGTKVFYDIGLIDRIDPYQALYEDQVQTTIIPESPTDAYTGFRPPTYDADSDARTLFESCESLGFYGWTNFGDVPLDYEGTGFGPLNLKYNFTYGMLLQFFRSKDRLWWQLAEPAARHMADIDVLHTKPKKTTVFWEGGVFGHSFHDRDGIIDPHRQSGPPGIDTYFGVPGLLTYYYMTGYEFAAETALEVADNVVWRWQNTLDSGGNFTGGIGYATVLEWYDNSRGCLTNISNKAGLGGLNSRGTANTLLILLEAARATGNTTYLDVCEWIVGLYRSSDSLFIGGPVPSLAGCRIRTWMINMYLVAVGKFLDTLNEFGRVDLVNATETLVLGATFFRDHVSIPRDANRNVFPYDWDYDGSGYDWDGLPDPAGDSGVNSWQLLAADMFAYAYKYSSNETFKTYAQKHFNAGAQDPLYEGDPVNYAFTKEAVNTANYGMIWIHHSNSVIVPAIHLLVIFIGLLIVSFTLVKMK